MPYSDRSNRPDRSDKMEREKRVIAVGARSSPLSRVQVQEVLKEIQQDHPEIEFDLHALLTTGDRDSHTSLRTLGKTDFFTREIDELVLKGVCRLGIHSAKDLPDPLADGLVLICLTKGVDPSDSLVLRDDETLETLRTGALIATSSVRREEAVKQLRSDLLFCDIRGTIGQRLDQLMDRKVDGVVIAEAALIRLGFIHLNRIPLPGSTVAGQGQLAVVAREQDEEMRDLFTCLDVRGLACAGKFFT